MLGNQANLIGRQMRVAVKRLKKEFDEIERSEEGLPFKVYPLEVTKETSISLSCLLFGQDNFLEWHFTIQGPTESVFERGLYHGRLIFPAEYPFAPPTLMFLTPSGRFQVSTKICLSVTGFHPEHWQPAWGARTMLIAIRDHFTVEDRGAIGYLGYDAQDRRQLALESRFYRCPSCDYHGPSDVLPSERAAIAHAEGASASSPAVGARSDAELGPIRVLQNYRTWLLFLSFAILVLALNLFYSISHQ